MPTAAIRPKLGWEELGLVEELFGDLGQVDAICLSMFASRFGSSQTIRII
jgi:hypothetical protein